MGTIYQSQRWRRASLERGTIGHFDQSPNTPRNGVHGTAIFSIGARCAAICTHVFLALELRACVRESQPAELARRCLLSV